MISRREFFKQLFSPRTIRALSRVDGLASLGRNLGVTPESVDACERAGLGLGNFNPKKRLAGVPAVESQGSAGRALDDAGRNQSGE